MPGDEDPESELRAASEQLYGLDPGDFVAARNELARRLRNDGNRDLAGRVAKLRRPSPAAWAVNQLARRHRTDLEGLLGLGEALRRAQERTLAGADPAELRDAGRARRDAVARLAESAAGLLAERGAGADAHYAEVAATLEAASFDPEAAAQVAGGRLTSGLETPSGFGEPPVVAPAGDEAAPSTSGQGEPVEVEDGAAGAADLLTDARRAASDAAERATVLAARAGDAVARAERRHRHVDEAEAEVARMQRALDEARRRADAADREVDGAQRAAAAAGAAADEAGERLRQAEQQVDELHRRETH